jgi:hypothetical protein
MKKIILLSCFFLSVLSLKSQNLFVKKKGTCENGEYLDIHYYKIVNAKDTSFFSNCFYKTGMFKHNSKQSKLKMAEDLLKFKGDTDLCSIEVRNYNPLSSTVLLNNITRYSIQVEALFLINLVLFDKPFNYSSYPLLYNKNTNKIENIKGKAISEAYENYKKYIQYLKNRNKDTKKHPLDSSLISRWY